MCALLVTLIMFLCPLMTTTIAAFFCSCPLCIALFAALTCISGAKFTLQCILSKCTQLEWQRCCSSLPRSLYPGLLPSGGCPAVPGSSCRCPGGVRLRPRPGPQESPAAGRDGGGRHEVSPQRWAGAIRPDTRPRCHLPFVLPQNICRLLQLGYISRGGEEADIEWKKLGKFQQENKLNKWNESRKWRDESSGQQFQPMSKDFMNLPAGIREVRSSK